MLRKLCCIIVCMHYLFLSCLAEENRFDAYPIEIDGKWGYCDAAGDLIISAQWAEAGEFCNGVARVSLEEDLGQFHFACGLIDQNGAYILPPQYNIIEEQDIFHISQQDEQGNALCGYWDKASGFYLPPQYAGVRDNFPYYSMRPHDQFIAARSPETGKWGFLHRSTGEIVLPFEYDDILFTFSDGFALVVQEEEMMDVWQVIDQKGQPVEYGEGIMPVWGPTANGIVIIAKAAVTEEEKQNALWGDIFGLANSEGKIILSPCCGLIEWIHDQAYAFCTSDSRWGLLNEKGEIIIAPQFRSEEDLMEYAQSK